MKLTVDFNVHSIIQGLRDNFFILGIIDQDTVLYELTDDNRLIQIDSYIESISSKLNTFFVDDVVENSDGVYVFGHQKVVKKEIIEYRANQKKSIKFKECVYHTFEKHAKAVTSNIVSEGEAGENVKQSDIERSNEVKDISSEDDGLGFINSVQNVEETKCIIYRNHIKMEEKTLTNHVINYRKIFVITYINRFYNNKLYTIISDRDRGKSKLFVNGESTRTIDQCIEAIIITNDRIYMSYKFNYYVTSLDGDILYSGNYYISMVVDRNMFIGNTDTDITPSLISFDNKVIRSFNGMITSVGGKFNTLAGVTLNDKIFVAVDDDIFEYDVKCYDCKISKGGNKILSFDSISINIIMLNALED